MNEQTGLLVANRGEIAMRIIRSARRCGFRTVAVTTADEPEAPHAREADRTVTLARSGAESYLDAEELALTAVREKCRFIHPGYGFLSESAQAARTFSAAGLTFVGPDADTLDLLGNKLNAKQYAESLGIPVLESSEVVTAPADAITFLDRIKGPAIVKSVAGGGGRGMRTLRNHDDVSEVLERSRSEVARNFGSGDIILERLIERARHIEVQLVGDGTSVQALSTRDCSVQRNFQKVVEQAPAQHLDPTLESALVDDSLRLGNALRLRGLATVEFLVDQSESGRYVFIEVNPRLQVEHGVTELVTGVDLVDAQLRIAEGQSLALLGLAKPMPVHGCAVEARVSLISSSAPVSSLTIPSGDNVRTDSVLIEGVRPATEFDPLVAKVMVHQVTGDMDSAVDALSSAVRQLSAGGVTLDTDAVLAILEHPDVRSGTAHTTLLGELEGDADQPQEQAGSIVARGPGSVVTVSVSEGDKVGAHDSIIIVESMKMETEYTPGSAAEVGAIHVSVGDQVHAGSRMVDLTADHAAVEEELTPAEHQITSGDRADVAENSRRHEQTLDASREHSVDKRHSRGKLTARENIAEIIAEGTFTEYGALAIAAQRNRRTLSDLEANTPADGLVAGFGKLKGSDDTETAVLAFDYTVMAGTQGLQGHRKAERVFKLAERRKLPLVIFAEGGGGRPGDTDNAARATGMDLGTFSALGRLVDIVPTVGIASGRCFAGNAALFAACELTIATQDANIGLGGPAMVESGGLGMVTAEDIGPAAEQADLGVVDVLVTDETAAADVARKYLEHLLRRRDEWAADDQSALNHQIPEKRSRTFVLRDLINLIADDDSVIEIGEQYAPSLVTALIRIEGQSLGLIANDGEQNGGAIDSASARKMAEFLIRCENHQVPIVSLCDTPGFMVGPESERTGPARAAARLFTVGAKLSVPLITVIIRRAFGLGAQAMAGGSFRVPEAVLAWPTAQIGAMGPEGAVRLAYRRELATIADEEDRKLEFDRLLAEYEESGRAFNAASVFELDDVIEPSMTRWWITQVLHSSQRRFTSSGE